MRSRAPLLPSSLALSMTFTLFAAAGRVSLEAQTMEEMQARMEQATALTEEHEALGYFLGEWDVDIRLFLSGAPGEEPTIRTSRGTARGEWVVEGRWLGIAITGEMMGSPYTGYSIRGWDSYARNWVTASVTSMDNALNVTRGVKVNPEGGVFAEYGFLDEYTTAELNKPYRTLTRIHDDDRYTTEVWDMGIGAEGMKVVEFDFTRR